MTRSEERDLATRAVTDADAYADIYTRCYPALLTCARRLLRNAEDAEDLVQELFVRVRPKLGQFAGDAALTSWLTRAMFNLHIDAARVAAARSERLSVEYTPFQPTAQRPNQSVIVPIVADVLRSLSDRDRAAAQSLLAGETKSELARASGVTPGAANTRRWRVRKILAESLGMA